MFMSFIMDSTMDATLNGNAAITETTEVITTERRLRPSEVKRRQLAHQLEGEVDALQQAREDLNAYTEAGPFYGAAAPVPNSIGCELGVVTRDEKTGTVQRTGFGFYLRSDHICNKKYDGNVQVP